MAERARLALPAIVMAAPLSLPGGGLAIKAISIAFDFALAFFVGKCVGLKCRESKAIPILAGLATLLAPTVVLNSSAWGQCDSIYTTFLVACLYFTLARRQAHAFVAFGLAVSFKLQAVFLAPLFLWLLAQRMAELTTKGAPARELRRTLLLGLLVPAVYLTTLVPAWLLGRPLLDLLMIYYEQSQSLALLSAGAPNLYAWIPNSLYPWWPAGLAFAVFAAALVAILIYRARAKVTAELTVLLATFSVLLMPYILPKMHARFFFPADVIAIVLAFHLPRLWPVPVIVGLASMISYPRAVTGMEPIATEWVALILLPMIAVLSWQLRAALAPPASTASIPASTDACSEPSKPRK